MTFRFERLSRLIGDRRFERYTILKMPEARHFTCLLNIHSEINNVK